MPQASFPPLPGSLPHYHSGRASPERYDNRYEQGFSESFVTTLGKTQLRPDPERLARRGHSTVGRYNRSLTHARVRISDTLHKKPCCMGPRLSGTSENSYSTHSGE